MGNSEWGTFENPKVIFESELKIYKTLFINKIAILKNVYELFFANLKLFKMNSLFY